MKARWDDLHRAIEARDSEGAERVWLELIESEPGSVDRFLEAAARLRDLPGGKRDAGLLLWMLAQALKEKGSDRDLVRVLAQLARTGPDDGSVRNGLVEAARKGYAGRSDLDALLEKSGVLGGTGPELAEQADALERYLRLEPGGFVFHKSGWGAGRIVEYLPEKGRCVIDFKGRPGHQMDIDAAAKLLERLPPTDVRALALSDPAGLRALAKEKPLDVLRQVVLRFKGDVLLHHVKDALVPDAVPEKEWNDWWKSARKAALIDPRFQVGTGRDPRIEYHEAARVDFRAQVEKTLKASETSASRRVAVKDLLSTVGADPEARAVLAEAARAEGARVGDPGLRLSWEVLLAEAEGRDADEVLRQAFVAAKEPGPLLDRLADDDFRARGARALLQVRPDGADVVLARARKDDPVAADVLADVLPKVGRSEDLERLLTEIDESPIELPRLFAWLAKGLRRGRWPTRTVSSYVLAERLLKVLDQVEYRARRAESTKDRDSVAALESVLSERGCAVLQEAAAQTDDVGARHLLRVLDKSRGIKGRPLQKMQDTILRVHPHVLKEPTAAEVAGEVPTGARAAHVYMTRDGMARLKADYERIVNEELPSNAAEIARAREFGDLSENAEYHAAREKQSLLTARAEAMKADLALAVAITPEIVRTDAVSVGTRVRLKDLGGEERTYTLLGPPDADAGRGVISYLTPLGQALMGKKTGDHVRLDIAGDVRELVVLAIENALA